MLTSFCEKGREYGLRRAQLQGKNEEDLKAGPGGNNKSFVLKHLPQANHYPDLTPAILWCEMGRSFTCAIGVARVNRRSNGETREKDKTPAAPAGEQILAARARTEHVCGGPENRAGNGRRPYPVFGSRHLVPAGRRARPEPSGHRALRDLPRAEGSFIRDVRDGYSRPDHGRTQGLFCRHGPVEKRIPRFRRHAHPLGSNPERPLRVGRRKKRPRKKGMDRADTHRPLGAPPHRLFFQRLRDLACAAGPGQAGRGRRLLRPALATDRTHPGGKRAA